MRLANTYPLKDAHTFSVCRFCTHCHTTHGKVNRRDRQPVEQGLSGGRGAARTKTEVSVNEITVVFRDLAGITNSSISNTDFVVKAAIRYRRPCWRCACATLRRRHRDRSPCAMVDRTPVVLASRVRIAAGRHRPGDGAR